jgi:ATP synthase protein I
MSGDRDTESFERRLAAAKDNAGRQGSAEGSAHQSVAAGSNAVSLAMRLGVELVAAMAIAVGIGWALDRLFHTRPWLMVLMVPVGMAAGLRNLIRAGQQRDRDGEG